MRQFQEADIDLTSEASIVSFKFAGRRSTNDIHSTHSNTAFVKGVVRRRHHQTRKLRAVHSRRCTPDQQEAKQHVVRGCCCASTDLPDGLGGVGSHMGGSQKILVFAVLFGKALLESTFCYRGKKRKALHASRSWVYDEMTACSQGGDECTEG